MPEEIFDVVNERDEVVGQRTRREVHQLGLLHRATHVLIFNSRGELFLQKRSLLKDNFPGTWDSSASGHLDCGEAYDVCAAREVTEELGLSPVPPLERLFYLQACPGTGQEFVWVYRCRSDGPFQLNPIEIETGGWFSPDALSAWIRQRPSEFANAFILVWQRYASDYLHAPATGAPA